MGDGEGNDPLAVVAILAPYVACGSQLGAVNLSNLIYLFKQINESK